MLAKGLPPNEVSFNTLVNGWVKKGFMDKAQRVVDEQMIARGLAPNEVWASTMASHASLSSAVALAIAETGPDCVMPTCVVNVVRSPVTPS